MEECTKLYHSLEAKQVQIEGEKARLEGMQAAIDVGQTVLADPLLHSLVMLCRQAHPREQLTKFMKSYTGAV